MEKVTYKDVRYATARTSASATRAWPQGLRLQSAATQPRADIQVDGHRYHAEPGEQQADQRQRQRVVHRQFGRGASGQFLQRHTILSRGDGSWKIPSPART